MTLSRHLWCIAFAAWALLMQGCRKETIGLIVHEVGANTTLPLQRIFFVDDSLGYVCGGTRYTIGILLKTYDGGQSWSAPDSILPSAGYSIYFKSAAAGWIGGNYSWLATTVDSAKTFSTYTSNLLPVQDIALSGSNLIWVGGNGYANGCIKFSTDEGITWKEQFYDNSLAAVQFTTPTTAYASGYGVIYKSTNGGETFFPLDVRGDFFVAMDFPSADVGYFAGYQGSILKTSDAGATFSKVMNGNAPFGKREHFETIQFWDENTGYVAGAAGTMYTTTNGGESWQQVEAFTAETLRDIHLFTANEGIVIGDNGKIYRFKAR